jgi:hypothetical protein
MGTDIQTIASLRIDMQRALPGKKILELLCDLSISSAGAGQSIIETLRVTSTFILPKQRSTSLATKL